jgi:hypothetical protein
MQFFEKKYFPFILLFIVVFISRLPFIYAGYGIEEDSWGIALAAFHTKFSGVYEPSRMPGHPTQELVYSALWGLGPIIFNALSALFSAISVVLFSLILKHLNFKHFFIAALAFAFIPVYYISSTYTIDFVWTETLVLISLYLLLKDEFIFCGIFIGLAIGCRITSGAMLLPFMIIIWQQNNLKQNFIHLLKISIPLIVVTILMFLPIYLQFGWSFLMYYDQFAYPPISKVLYKMTLGVFGFIGVLSIVMGVFAIFQNRKKQIFGTLFQNQLDKKILIANYAMLFLFTISYMRLPQKSGYMIPILPFVILLFGYYLNSKQFQYLCIAFIFSSFLCSINLTDKLRGASYSKCATIFTISGQELFFDPLSGPIFSDYSKRKQKLNYTDEVIETAKTINKKTVIIAGWWYNQLMVEMINRNANKNVIYEGYIDSGKMNKYVSGGYEIYFLPEQNKYNDEMFKMNSTDRLASPLILTTPKSN